MTLLRALLSSGRFSSLARAALVAVAVALVASADAPAPARAQTQTYLNTSDAITQASCGTGASSYLFLSPNFTVASGATSAVSFAITVNSDAGTATLTTASLSIQNLDGSPYRPNATFYGHIHAKTCEDGAAGGHWLYNTSVVGTVESNEFWVAFQGAPSSSSPDAWAGVLSASAKVPDARIRSFVVHRPAAAGGAKLVCCNLNYVLKSNKSAGAVARAGWAGSALALVAAFAFVVGVGA